MDRLKVSICVAYYNRSEYVKECIQSLLDQDYDSFEVIVVNDGSKDPLTSQFLNEMIDHRLTVIHQENSGFVGAIRAAILAAKGKYIAIQGAGDISLKDRIRRQASVLDNKPDVGIVGCLFENVVYGGAEHGKRIKRTYENQDISASDFLKGANPLGHGEVMFRRSIYDRVGGYRPYFKFSQDLDLWLLMIEHCGVKVIQEVLYERRMFMKDGVSTDVEKQFLQKYLADFARQCYHDRQEFGVDFVEKYGNHAGLFKKPSKELSKMISSKIVNGMRTNEDVFVLQYLNRLSKPEPVTFKLVVAKILLKFYQYSLGKRFVKVFMALTSRG